MFEIKLSSKLIMAFLLVSTFLQIRCGSGGGANKTHWDVGDKELVVLSKFIDTCYSSRELPSSPDSFKVCLIIPSTGCPGCISSAEQLLVSLIKGKYPVRYILTNIISLKTLRLKVGDSILHDPRVYVDKANYLRDQVLGLKNTYPLICYISKDRQILRREYMEPENPSAVKDLYDYLAIKY
jgi:hypothetical protein